ncbi:MAG: 4Fe-4S ferredoxin [Armatimonadota bacterium]
MATQDGTRPSQLGQWPIQLHLVPPTAPYFEKSDVLLAADCVAFAIGDFHKDHLAGHSLAIACPKLDEGLEIYREKLTALVDEAEINTLTVMTMEVPCCMGLLELAKSAVDQASRKIPVKSLVVSLQGKILQEEWC